MLMEVLLASEVFWRRRRLKRGSRAEVKLRWGSEMSHLGDWFASQSSIDGAESPCSACEGRIRAESDQCSEIRVAAVVSIMAMDKVGDGVANIDYWLDEMGLTHHFLAKPMEQMNGQMVACIWRLMAGQWARAAAMALGEWVAGRWGNELGFPLWCQ